MGIKLYTSRIVLKELGIDDYGVYMVVGGVISMLNFFSVSMATSTQRYLNYEIGNPKGSIKRLKDIFSTSLTIHILIALILLALTETIGLWFVNNKLVIPPNKMFGANVVYQTSIFIFCLNILRVPFSAAIIAHERMHIYAWISIMEAVLTLLISFALVLIPTMKLAWYGILLMMIQIIISGWYICSCLNKFAECRIRIVFIPDLLKEMSQFAGWNLFGSLSWIVRGQGMGIILNTFFGPALNAAKGIAEQVSSAVNSLNSNFLVALNPQITKDYAADDMEKMELLTYRGIKFSSFLMWCLCLPVIISAPTILSLWLNIVPRYTDIFTILVISDCLVGNLFGSPLVTAINATGNVRNYLITVSSVLLLVLPLGYFALKCDYPPQTIFYLNIILNISAGIIRLWFCRRLLNFSIRSYLRSVLMPFFIVVALSLIFSIYVAKLIYQCEINGLLYLIVTTLISIMIILVIGWVCGLSQSERNTIKKIVRKRISVASSPR